jgi:hypothetical protein
MAPRITSAVLIATIVCTGCATHGADIPPPSAWSAVQALPPDTRVRVTLRWNESVIGTVASVDAERIHIAGHGEPNGFNRTDVMKVYVREGRQTAKYRRRGALIGLSAGAVAIASDKGTFGMLLAVYWTALGAAVGALGGHFTPVESLVYAAARAVTVSAYRPFRSEAPQ